MDDANDDDDVNNDDGDDGDDMGKDDSDDDDSDSKQCDSILKTIPAIAPVVSKPFAVMSNPATEKRVLSYQTPD